MGVGGSEVLFALMLLRSSFEELSEALPQLTRSDEATIVIERIKNNSVMRKLGIDSIRNKARKNLAKSNIAR